MAPTSLTRTVRSRRRGIAVLLAAAVGGLGVFLGRGSLVGSSGAQAPRPAQVAPPRGRPAEVSAEGRLPSGVPGGAPALAGDGAGALGIADGEVPDGVTVFDDGYPAVANLDADLLGALRRAATAAEDDGVEVYVNSGWRSPAYQEQLLDEAVARYGSREEAARWVATPATSAHVSGDAVDLGHAAAVAWLAEHGAAYGLCRVYGNEPWHYELRLAAADDGCPVLYADPTQDPRMQP